MYARFPTFGVGVVTAGLLAALTGSAQDEAVRARKVVVQAAHERLARVLATGEVEGRLVERFPGSYVFVPSALGLAQAPVINSDKVAALAVGLPVWVRGTVEPGGQLRIESYELKPPPMARGSTSPVAVARIQRSADDIVSALKQAIKPGAMNVEERALTGPSEAARTTRQSIAQFVSDYRQAVTAANPDPAMVAEIVKEWAAVRPYVATLFSDERQYKALYGEADNYAPWRYGRIHQQSPSVVAIGEAGRNTSRCSGVLIARDLVLTAGHCFLGKQPSEMQVWFDYVEQPDGTPVPPIQRLAITGPVAPLPSRWADVLAGNFGPDLLDYAIVRFAAPPGQQPGPAGAQPQCLRSIPLARGDAVYVVGYPRGERATVHDNARVYLPYRILEGHFYDLRLNVEADFLGRAERSQVMEEFDRSYELRKDENDIPWRYFHNVTEGGQPRMGIISDTFRGNSGGPVYDHDREQCVVGVFIAGSQDTGKRLTPNWKEHERVLPISAVLDDLGRNAATASLVQHLTISK